MNLPCKPESDKAFLSPERHAQGCEPAARIATKEDRDTLAKEFVTASQTEAQQKDSVMTENTSPRTDTLEAPAEFTLSGDRETLDGKPVFDGPEVELPEADASIWSDWTAADGVPVTLNSERPFTMHELEGVHGAVGAIIAKIQAVETAASESPHPYATGDNVAHLVKDFGLTTTEIGVLYVTIGERPAWHPEVTCSFIVEARRRGNDGLLALQALALSAAPDTHPGGLQLGRDHKLSRLGCLWDYLDLLTGYITEDSKDHWRDGNCSSRKKTMDPKLTGEEKCTKREHAESALGFLRMAAADTQHRKHAVAYYTELCLQYGATNAEVSAALFGEHVRTAA